MNVLRNTYGYVFKDEELGQINLLLAENGCDIVNETTEFILNKPIEPIQG